MYTQYITTVMNNMYYYFQLWLIFVALIGLEYEQTS